MENNSIEKLSKRLQELNRKEIEELAKIESKKFSDFSTKLRESLQKELSTIENDTKKTLASIKSELQEIVELNNEINRTSGWQIAFISLIVGILIGAGIPTLWALKHSTSFENDGKIEFWVKIWEKEKK